MNEPEKPPPPAQSKIVQICTIVCLAIGIGVFQVVAPRFFPTPPGGGFNYERILAAGGVGLVSALIGAGIGTLIEKLRK